MKTRIVHPAGRRERALRTLAPMVTAASAPQIGILENRKANARLLLVEMGRRLAERIGAPAPRVFDKENASAACHPDRLRAIAGEVDLVLTGSAD